MNQRGEHQSGRVPLATLEKNALVLAQVWLFMKDYPGCAADIVMLLGGPAALAMNANHSGIKTVKTLCIFGVNSDGVNGPLDCLHKMFVAMMFSSLSTDGGGVDGLELPVGTKGVSSSTMTSLFAKKPLGDETLDSIQVFITAWRALLGAPRSLFAGGQVGVCMREKCDEPSVALVCFSTATFSMERCVHVEDALPVCVHHKEKFYGSTQNYYQTYKTQAQTLLVQVGDLKARVDTLEASEALLKTEAVARKEILLRQYELQQYEFQQLDALKYELEREQFAGRTSREQFAEQMDQLHRYYAEERREIEGQLQQQIDISAGLRDDASTITAGANILLQEQFSETQQNYIDLHREIDRVRSERAALELAATQSDALTASSSGCDLPDGEQRCV